MASTEIGDFAATNSSKCCLFIRKKKSVPVLDYLLFFDDMTIQFVNQLKGKLLVFFNKHFMIF